MAQNRIVQALYDLKDNVTAKLKRIGEALGQNRADVKKTADETERNNQRSTESFRKMADSVGVFRKALAAVAGFAGLVKLKNALLDVLQTGDKFELLGKRFEAVFGGLEQGSAALAKIKNLAKETPQTLDEVANAAVKLKAFGLDPLDGTLKALIDQNAKLGGSNEDLQNTILAVGQAWTKQKLQGDDIRQLLEKGIPVYDLLAKATGKTAQEVQKLAGAGQLGRDSIRALLTEIGKSADGAAAAQMKTLTGLVSNLRDTFDDFLVRIANAGALDFVKSKLTELGRTISELSISGRLQEIATSISNAIVGTGKAIAATVKFVYDYSAAIVLLAKAYALVKVQSFLDGLALIATGTTKASTAVRLLSAAITAIPAVRIAVIGAAAVTLASDNLRRLGEVIGENLPETQKWTARIAELKREIREGAEVFKAASERFEQFRTTQILSSDAAAKLSDAERKAQAEQMAGLEEYLKLRIRYYEQLKAAESLNEDGIKFLEELKLRLAAVSAGYDALAEGARLAGDALENKLTVGAQILARDLAGIGESSKVATERIGALFTDLDKLNTVEVGDVALAVQKVGEASDISARRVSDGLAASLSKLSGSDLLRFQLSASAAFEAVGRSGDKTAVVLDTTLRVAMDRLKVDAAQTGEAFSKSGKETIATFQAIAENARATGQQIAASFRAALGEVKTKQEAEALGAALKSAALTGKIGFDQLALSTRELNERVRTITANLSPLASQFEILGIKSQAQLNAIRDNARDAFEAVIEGARKGTAAQEDIVRAFRAYSEAATAAAADSSSAIKEQLQAQLDLQAAALGIADALDKAGSSGKAAGDTTASAFGAAEKKIQDAADAAGNLSEKATDASDGLGTLADSASKIATRAQQAGVSLGYMTEEAANAISAAVGVDGINNAMRRYENQIFATKEELDDFTRAQVEAADAAANASKQLTDLVDRLRDQRDQASGNEAAAEERRFQKELSQIDELAKAAGYADQATVNEARRLAEEEHKRKLREIEERKRAEINAAREAAEARNSGSATQTETNTSGSGSSSNVRPGSSSTTEVRITINGNTIGAFSPGSPGFDQAITAAVLRALRQASVSSGSGTFIGG